MGASAIKGWLNILKLKSMDMNVIAIPARADSRAARGVMRLTNSAMKEPRISITPLRKQATSPTFQAQMGSLVS